MAVKERLNQTISKDLDTGLDDLDLAYIEQLRQSGIDESLIEQFVSLSRQETETKDK